MGSSVTETFPAPGTGRFMERYSVCATLELTTPIDGVRALSESAIVF
ncbi:MAG TPA: hypothetical protein V6D12_21520 [Candidatus Obscuribacterales bacterium]